MNNETIIPKEGLYVSRTDPYVRLVVTEVHVVDDGDDDDIYFLATVVNEGDEDDMSALSYEYEPDEWYRLVKNQQLEYIP
ncbi:hypothetical protein ACXEHV_000943 [Klebsiella quasipneumoniae]|uniref:hypothetical protein n=1 Tax=Klebsiella oxytoca TaxID=571 RepID=UPI000659534A|nr:hypothetical protein [Klebsiella oxytoca]KLY10055.1 hypothetical protein SK88_03894 [Klebsiella oxytoca]MDU7358670.1 hypothetical protein [Klebsiella oxytoca]